MIFPAVPPGLLRVDKLIVSRPETSTDADGVDDAVYLPVPTVTAGTYALPSGADLILAGQRASKVDALVLFDPGADVRAGDRIDVRGFTVQVVEVEDVRNRLRARVRRISPPN